MQKFGRLGVLFILILLFVFQLPSMGQNKKSFVITGKIDPEVTTAKSGLIEISKTGGERTTVDVPKNGRFRLELEYFNEFTLIFTVPGNFSKTIVISTDIPQDVWERDNDFPPYPMVVKLVKEIEGIDKSFALKPTGKVFYSKKTDNFESEIIMNDAMFAQQVETAKRQSGDVKKEEKTISKQEAQELAGKQKSYEQSIAEADNLFKKGEYLNAMLKYQEAKKLFPEKPYANDRIAEIQELVKVLENTEKQSAELEKKYKDAIARANALFEQKTYQQARPVYEEALQIKQADAFAQGRIQEIDRLIAQQGKQKQFDELVAQADKSYQSKQLDQALTLYTQAGQLIPENEYPKKQIKLINGEKEQLAKAEQQEKEYQALIARADQQFEKKDYAVAQNDYTKAVSLKPAETYPANRIKEIDQILKTAQEAKLAEEKYQSVIARADQSFASQSYEEAKKVYGEALAMKPTEAYPTAQISKIDEILAEKAKSEQAEMEFRAMVGKGDEAFTQKEYEVAKTHFTGALALKPNTAEVIAKIKNIDSILQKIAEDKKKEEDRLLALAKEKEKAYNAAINAANKNVTDKRYTEAKSKFQEALQVIPEADYPKQQIQRLDALLAQADAERQKEELYASTLKEAEALFTGKNYQNARLTYTKASEIKPSEALPAQRIREIDQILNELALKEAKDKALEASYQEVIKRADQQFAAKEYPSARSTYGEALALKSGEQYPQTQIAEIDRIMADLQLTKYNEAIAAGDRAFQSDQLDEATTHYELALKTKDNDTYAKNQLGEITKRRAVLLAEQDRLNKLNEQYNTLIAGADTDFKNKGYEEAKRKYEEGLALKPQETYPKEQLEKINTLLAELRNQEETNRLYAQSMKSAEDAFRQNKLKEARDAYQKAHDYKPSEPVPTSKIAELNTMMAQLEEAARLAAQEEANQQAKAKADKEQYDKAIAEADKAFGEKQYPIAKGRYTDALNIFASEKYPKDQIIQIDALIAQQNEAARLAAQEEANRQAKAKADKEQYDKAIAEADKAFGEKQYPIAKGRYTDALTIFASEKYPKDQIIQIDALIAQQNEAAKLAAQEEANRQAKAKADKEQYDKAIAEADKAFGEKQYPIAKGRYTDALNIFASEKYPKDQIIQIDALIAQQNEAAKLAAQEEANRQAKAKADKEQYDKAIAEADKAFGEKQYPIAKGRYTDALNIFASEKYPKDQIIQIDALIAQQNEAAKLAAQEEANRQAKAKANKEQYDKAIAEADKAFGEKQYPVAKGRYTDALNIFASEKYPKDQIIQIDALIARQEEEAKQAALLAQAKEPVIQAEAPKAAPVETAQMTEARAQSYRTINNYDEAIRKADEAFGIKDYSVARFFYYKASDLKPKEAYPANQIELIRKLVDSELSSVDRTGYEKIIAQADEAFQKQNYTIAKFFYYKALEVKSWEKYPKDRIHEILVLTNSLLSEKEEKEYSEMIAKADEALVVKDIAIARFYYNKALAMKKDEEYPKIKIKDIQKILDQDKLDQQESEYQKLIELGDQELQAENYSIARFHYNKAITMRPNEKYPKDQLKRIREALDKQKK